MRHPRSHPYRADVDGLRAVAIIPVVLFHLGLASFAGGFVGVDVFFVISGFLITSIIHAEVLEGRFSFVTFYERRTRRLFPALFTVIAVTTAASVALLLPSDLVEFSKSLVATTLFAANIHFWSSAGYFEGPAETKPFLHAWSLAVEEQFYIVYPITLLVIARLARERLEWILAGLAIVSFAACVWVTHQWPDAAFYLPQFRAWQLLAGALLAVGAFPAPDRQWLRDLLSVVGLGAIAVAVLTFSHDTPFPGAHALVPSLGAALVIYTGIGGTSAGGWLLSLRPIVFIGLISYSLYLWHWPIVVFARYVLVRDPHGWEQAAVVVASVAMAMLSWRFVEQPFRARGGPISRRAIFLGTAVFLPVFVALGLVGVAGRGFPGRVAPEVTALLGTEAEQARYRAFLDACFDTDVDRVRGGRLCKLGSEAAPSFLVWGDSHALAMRTAIERVARDAGRAGLFAASSACPPLLGTERREATNRAECRAFNDAVAEQVAPRPELGTVVLVGRWALNVVGTRSGTEPGKTVVLSDGGTGGNLAVFRAGLERTLARLDELGKDVVFLTSVPEIGFDVPTTLARARLFSRPAPSPPSAGEFHERQREVEAIVTELADRYPLRVIDLSAPFLSKGASVVVDGDGLPLYRDNHHLNERGGDRLVEPLAALFPQR